jgi:HK97 family phage major capsid protein
MTIEQMKARLAAIVATLGDLQKVEDLNDEQMEQVNTLNAEFEGLTKKIEAKEKLESMSAKLTTGTRNVPAQPIEAKVQVGQNRIEQDPKRGFKNAGEFYAAVYKKDVKILNAAGLNESSGSDGGFLIPEDFRLDIQKKIQGDESLLPMTRQYQTASNNITLPTYEGAPYDSSGVIQAYWEGEAQAFTASKAKFGQASMRLHKLTALVPVTEEVLEDAPLLESWIRQNAPEAMVSKVNTAIIRGSGAGMPQGFLNSSFKKKVLKESGQAADTVLFENINKMLGALLPSSIPRASWLINPNVLPQLRLMKFTDNSPVYLPGMNVAGAPYGTLFGIPLKPMMGGLKALGDEGDICLVDLSYVQTAMKVSQGMGIRADVSTHVYFDTDEVAFKFVMRMAGNCPFKAPVTNEAGDFVASGFVTLEDRA